MVSVPICRICGRHEEKYVTTAVQPVVHIRAGSHSGEEIQHWVVDTKIELLGFYDNSSNRDSSLLFHLLTNTNLVLLFSLFVVSYPPDSWEIYLSECVWLILGTVGEFYSLGDWWQQGLNWQKNQYNQ